MNKLLVILPLLALLTTGIVFTISQNKDGNLEAAIPTLSEWKKCRQDSLIYDNSHDYKYSTVEQRDSFADL